MNPDGKYETLLTKVEMLQQDICDLYSMATIASDLFDNLCFTKSDSGNFTLNLHSENRSKLTFAVDNTRSRAFDLKRRGDLVLEGVLHDGRSS